MRDLIRTRLAAVRAVRTARQQLSAFLLRHERIYPHGRTAWTKAHRGWLVDQNFAQPAQQIVLAECIEAVHLCEQRRDRVAGYLRAQIPSWSLFPLVRNLSALRGLDTIACAGLAAAIGDPSRFATAPDFMAYLGLVPSEHSTGPKRRTGAITKAGSCPHSADRGGTQLSPPSPRRASQAGRRRGCAGDGARNRLESADPVVPALPPHDGQGQVEASCSHSDRA
jgi:transposase